MNSDKYKNVPGYGGWTSGHWLATFVVAFFPVFIAWELIQLYRRRKGNKSALTFSQFLTKRARVSKGWAYVTLGFSLFIFVVGLWLIFHLEGLCHVFNVACNIDI